MNDRDFAPLIGEIRKNLEEKGFPVKTQRDFPNRSEVIEIIELCSRIMFPGFFEDGQVYSVSSSRNFQSLFAQLDEKLYGQLMIALKNCECKEVKECARRTEREFLERLPYVQGMLLKDIEAMFDGDPAALSRESIILSYPGFYAVMVFRLAHELYTRNVPLLPRMMTEHAHSLTGIDINPGATIGEYFCMDHGTGIVIGETTEIGNWCKLYQGVTLGALSTSLGQQMSGVKRHPKLEDHVTIYSNASILGGATVIGEGAVVGGSAFITESVPKNARVVMKAGEMSIRMKEQKD